MISAVPNATNTNTKKKNHKIQKFSVSIFSKKSSFELINTSGIHPFHRITCTF